MSSRPYEIEAVRRLLLPADHDDAAAREAAWRSLHAARPRRTATPAHWSRRLRIGVPLALAAAAAGVAGPLVVTGGHGGGGLSTLSAQPAAAAVLERAAEQLRDDRPLGPGEVRVVRVDMRQLVVQEDAAGHARGFVLPRAWEDRVDREGRWSWSAHPDGAPVFASDAARAAYEAAFGPYEPVSPKPAVMDATRSAEDPNPDLLGLSSNDVLALPADPGQLRARLEALRGAQPADGPNDIATMAIRLLVMGPTPPALRAALAEVLAQLPGVRVAGEEVVGSELATTLDLPDHDGWRTQVVIGARDGRLLATRTVLTEPDPQIPGSHAGMVLDLQVYSTAIVRSFAAPVAFDPAAVAGPMPPDAR